MALNWEAGIVMGAGSFGGNYADIRKKNEERQFQSLQNDEKLRKQLVLSEYQQALKQEGQEIGRDAEGNIVRGQIAQRPEGMGTRANAPQQGALRGYENVAQTEQEYKIAEQERRAEEKRKQNITDQKEMFTWKAAQALAAKEPSKGEKLALIAEGQPEDPKQWSDEAKLHASLLGIPQGALWDKETKPQEIPAGTYIKWHGQIVDELLAGKTVEDGGILWFDSTEYEEDIMTDGKPDPAKADVVATKKLKQKASDMGFKTPETKEIQKPQLPLKTERAKATEYNSRDDVRAAYRAGKITKAEAKKIISGL